MDGVLSKEPKNRPSHVRRQHRANHCSRMGKVWVALADVAWRCHPSKGGISGN